MEDIARSIGKLEGKLDGICDDIRELKDIAEKTHKRIHKIEMTSAAFGGAMGVITSIIHAKLKNILGI